MEQTRTGTRNKYGTISSISTQKISGKPNELNSIQRIHNENIEENSTSFIHSIKNRHNYKSWKLGSINIRSGKEKSEGAKMYSVAKEMDRLGITICCLQEVRYRNNDKRTISLPSGNEIRFYMEWAKKTKGQWSWISCKKGQKHYNCRARHTRPTTNCNEYKLIRI